MAHQKKIASFGIVLPAAGSSQRLGKPKQLLAFRGKTLLKHAVETALAAGGVGTVVVIGAEATRMREELKDDPVEILVNQRYKQGMASSLTAGLRLIVEKYPDIDGALIMLCDQPFVSGEHLRKLVQVQHDSGKAIVSSYYQNRAGVPALFHKTLFSGLLQLQGDRGARELIEQYEDESERVPFEPGALDIDTSEAAEAMLRHPDNKDQPTGKMPS